MIILLEPCDFLVEIGACQFVIEMQRDVSQFVEGIKQTFVESRAVDCSNILAEGT